MGKLREAQLCGEALIAKTPFKQKNGRSTYMYMCFASDLLCDFICFHVNLLESEQIRF
jgi:hypothetical protein